MLPELVIRRHAYRMLSLLLLSAAGLFYSATVSAEIEWQGNGFGSIAAGVLNDDSINEAIAFGHNTYYDSLQFKPDSKLGYQLSSRFSDQLSTTLQAVMNSENDFRPELQWAYLTYRPAADLHFNIGRQLRPIYQHSDHINIAYSYPWIRPPVEVYSRYIAFFSAMEAVSAHYSHMLGDWLLDWSIYYGQSSGSSTLISGERLDYKTRDDYGLAVSLEKNNLSLRLTRTIIPNIDVTADPGPEQLFYLLQQTGFGNLIDTLATQNIRAGFYGLSANYDNGDWLASAEYIMVDTSRSLAPDERSWYATLGRRLGAWTLHYTYGSTDRRNNNRFTDSIRAMMAIQPELAGISLQQLADTIDRETLATDADINSQTFGVRYDFDSPFALKLEYQKISDEGNQLENELFSASLDFVF